MKYNPDLVKDVAAAIAKLAQNKAKAGNDCATSGMGDMMSKMFGCDSTCNSVPHAMQCTGIEKK
jgi:hypothetical protein